MFKGTMIEDINPQYVIKGTKSRLNCSFTWNDNIMSSDKVPPYQTITFKSILLSPSYPSFLEVPWLKIYPEAKSAYDCGLYVILYRGNIHQRPIASCHPYIFSPEGARQDHGQDKRISSNDQSR